MPIRVIVGFKLGLNSSFRVNNAVICPGNSLSKISWDKVTFAHLQKNVCNKYHIANCIINPSPLFIGYVKSTQNKIDTLRFYFDIIRLTSVPHPPPLY